MILMLNIYSLALRIIDWQVPILLGTPTYLISCSTFWGKKKGRGKGDKL